MCGHRRQSLGNGGFTLVELVTVMLIMGVLAVAAAPRFMQNDTQERATAEQLRTNLRYAQRVAATRNRDVCVVVAARTVRFTIASAAGANVACPAAASVTPYNDSTGSLDIVPVAATVTFSPAGNFRFTPTGVLRSNTGAALGVRTINVQRSGATLVTMSIQPENGFVLSSAS